MTKCGKSILPECAYFATNGCVSPFNCPYKVENESITTATSTPCNLYPLETDKDAEISRLQAKNAELRATISKMETVEKELRDRLDNTVELPCKIGDEVYEVHGKCDRKNCVYNGYYGQWRCDYGGKTNCNPFITVNKFRYCDIPMVGKTIFVTKEAAEARLKELKGEKE